MRTAGKIGALEGFSAAPVTRQASARLIEHRDRGHRRELVLSAIGT